MDQFQELCELLVDLCQRLRDDVSAVLGEVAQVRNAQKEAVESAMAAARLLLDIQRVVCDEDDSDYDPDVDGMQLSDEEDEELEDDEKCQE